MTINLESGGPQAAPGRTAWIDFAKGIGIILVVLGHALRGLRSSRILGGEHEAEFRFVDSWIYSFHMPLFFLISGLFANRGSGRDSGRFVRDKLGTIAYPYLVWSTLQTLAQAASGGYANHKTSPLDLVGMLVTPIMQFWFLYALLLIAFGFHLLRRLGFGPAASLAILAALWAAQTQTPLTSWIPLRDAINYGDYYALGAVLIQYKAPARLEGAPAIVPTLIAGLGFGVITIWTSIGRRPTPWLVPVLAMSGILASAALAVLLSRLAGFDFIRVLGVHSLEIYVAHTIASAGVRFALQKLAHTNDLSLHLALGTLVGLIAPVILAVLCRRFGADFLFRLPRRASRPASADQPSPGQA